MRDQYENAKRRKPSEPSTSSSAVHELFRSEQNTRRRCWNRSPGRIHYHPLVVPVLPIKVNPISQPIVTRHYLKIISDIILTLSRQGMPFRGHDESDDSSNKGNESYNKYFNLSSSGIQNDIINNAGNIIQSKIIGEIKECGASAIMVDEARCFKEQQLSFCVRYTKKLEIEERFLGFVECSQQRDASSLCTLIINFIDKLGLRNFPIIAQAYDGASVMSGRNGGLQAKIREIHPEAIYIHCMAHRLNLAVVDSCNDIQGVKEFFNILESLFVHFSQPSNHKTFIETQKALGTKTLELSRISDTRWSCRSNNCQGVKNNYSSIIVALKYEIEENSNRNVVEAMGLLTSLTTKKVSS
ncbi:zinc finger MYM-type protein 1-like [Sitophilus oryzae]|uniref:Zinc finger MYM-type protein 1-like n=1 Tax=Sitophilus oryzae TaxID=7048 RepID=A0A6J2XRB5_SITOR|nr:zinc finger MYM-type protein 1-like [Sitophilus oryzae]